MVAKFDLFSAEGRGFESKSATDTRVTTDKNDPFLNMGFKHGKKWVDKNGAKCNVGFGRITKNTRVSQSGHHADSLCAVSKLFMARSPEATAQGVPKLREASPGRQPCCSRHRPLERSWLARKAHSRLFRTLTNGGKVQSQKRCPSPSGPPQNLQEI